MAKKKDARKKSAKGTPRDDSAPAKADKLTGKKKKQKKAGAPSQVAPVTQLGAPPVTLVEAPAAPVPEAPAAPVPEAPAAPDTGDVGDLTDVLREALRMRPGRRLADIDPGSTPSFAGDKRDAEKVMAATADEVADWQERLYAEAKGGGTRSLLLVVQGMDTSGKGGIMRHVIGLMDPQGVNITAFKAPTPEERRHPFLWRIRQALPTPGRIGVFDRSHYEDVLIVRVHNVVGRTTWTRRYGQINTFERTTIRQGTTVVKVMLHIGRDEQKARLAERLARPDKYWKFNPGDIDERQLWDDYQVAYQAVLDRTSTDEAPWYVVPANEKWYARLAVQHILLGELRAMNPQWPPAHFDVAEQQARLDAT